MMVTIKKYSCLWAALLCLAFTACMNPTQAEAPALTGIDTPEETDTPEEPDTPDKPDKPDKPEEDEDDDDDDDEEDEYDDDDTSDKPDKPEEKDAPLTARTLQLVAVEGFVVADAVAGAVVAEIDLPLPWVVTLPAGEDNALFEIVDARTAWAVPLPKVQVVIKEAALEWGSYLVVPTFSNPTGGSFTKKIDFTVSETLPAFTKPLIVNPQIVAVSQTDGSITSKIVITMNRKIPGADGYKVYLGTSNAPSTAVALPITVSKDAASKEIAHTEVTGGILQGTTYYVWLRAYKGTSEAPFGVYTEIRTSDPIDPYWWLDSDGTGIDWWDSGTDSYMFYFKDLDGDGTGETLILGYCVVGSQTSGVGQGHWIVRHHTSFNPTQLQKDVPHTKTGHYTTMEDLTTDMNGNLAAAGVFIVETNRVGNPFYGNYYWGHKTIQTADVTRTNPFSKTVRVKDTVHSYLSMAWNQSLGNSGNYKATLAEGLDFWTQANFKAFVAFVAIPWYPVVAGPDKANPVAGGKYKYGTPYP